MVNIYICVVKIYLLIALRCMHTVLRTKYIRCCVLSTYGIPWYAMHPNFLPDFLGGRQTQPIGNPHEGTNRQGNTIAL